MLTWSFPRVPSKTRVTTHSHNSQELKNLLTSNYYSVLYYNSEIWHIPSLSPNLKQKLLSASASALKSISKIFTSDISFERLHTINQRGTPEQMLKYKLSLQIYKLYNSEKMTEDWIDLNNQQNFNARVNKLLVSNNSNYKIGKNLLVNRFTTLNNQIELNWLNLSFDSYKIKCKTLYL